MTPEEALATLEGLSPEEIAVKLWRAGITGQQKTIYSCPLANYFKKLIGPGYYAASDALVYHQSRPAIMRRWSLPIGAMRLIARFDRGAFPELREPA